MPRVETLGVIISSDTRLISDDFPEDRIFADLLNLSRMSDGAVQEGLHSFLSVLFESLDDHLGEVSEYLITLS